MNGGSDSTRHSRRVWLLAVVMGALPACSSQSAASPRPTTTLAPAATSTTVSAACSPARPAPPNGAQTLTFGGEPRTYLLALPARYDGRSAYPLVFDFHGFASNGPAQEANTSIGAKGADRGYIVVTPSSDPPEWNEFSAPNRPDDYGFAHALVADLEARLCVDPQRVYAAGHSNGSAFVGFLVCKPPYVFAAVAMVSATVPSICPDGVAPAVLAIAGTADPQVPYAGGKVAGSTIAIPAATDTIEAYVTRYHCNRVPAGDQPLIGVDRVRYSACVDGADVVLDTVVGGTHHWPGGAAAATDPTDSDAGRHFDATAAILDFFDHHHRPPQR